MTEDPRSEKRKNKEDPRSKKERKKTRIPGLNKKERKRGSQVPGKVHNWSLSNARSAKGLNFSFLKESCCTSTWHVLLYYIM